MTSAFNIIYAAIQEGDLGDAQDAIKENWGCLHPGEWPLVKILMTSFNTGGGGGGDNVSAVDNGDGTTTLTINSNDFELLTAEP